MDRRSDPLGCAAARAGDGGVVVADPGGGTLGGEPPASEPSVDRSNVSRDTSAANEAPVISKAVRHTPLTEIESPDFVPSVTTVAETTKRALPPSNSIELTLPFSSIIPVNIKKYDRLSSLSRLHENFLYGSQGSTGTG